MNKKNGFTLLELLVVIMIVGILAGVGMASFSTTQKRARDAKRKEDMLSVQKAFEQYYGDNGDQYNASCSAMASGYLAGGLPTDPRNSGAYVYGYACKTYGYYYCAKLENGQGNAAAVGSCNDTTQICSFTAGTAYFCVTNLQ